MNEIATLTARAFNELYAPLWAKIPETIPSNYDGPLFMFCPDDDDEEYTCFAWTKEDDKQGYPVCPLVAVAAMSRAAVEDWLRTKRRIQINEPATGCDPQFLEWVMLMPADGYDKGRNIIRAAPTIHHALVAAALAVAEGG